MCGSATRNRAHFLHCQFFGKVPLILSSSRLNRTCHDHSPFFLSRILFFSCHSCVLNKGLLYIRPKKHRGWEQIPRAVHVHNRRNIHLTYKCFVVHISLVDFSSETTISHSQVNFMMSSIQKIDLPPKKIQNQTSVLPFPLLLGF